MVDTWIMPKSNRNWLISYPRSGNTWIRLFFEYYTDISTRSIVVPFKPLEVETKETFIWKKHEIFHEEIDETDRCIFIIRSPFNAIPSSIKYDGENFDDETVERYIEHYIAEITEYEKYKGNKIFVFYEDLVMDFKNAIIPVIKFLELLVDDDKIDIFIDKNKEMFNKASKWFTEMVPGKTGDNIYGDMRFNTRRDSLTSEQQNMIFKKIEDINILWRYLK